LTVDRGGELLARPADRVLLLLDLCPDRRPWNRRDAAKEKELGRARVNSHANADIGLIGEHQIVGERRSGLYVKGKDVIPVAVTIALKVGHSEGRTVNPGLGTGGRLGGANLEYSGHN